MKNKHPHAAVVLVLGLAMAGLHLADLLLWSEADTGFAAAGSVWLRYIPWLAAFALPYLPARRAAAQPAGLQDTNKPLGVCMALAGAVLLASGVAAGNTARYAILYPEVLSGSCPLWAAWADLLLPIFAGAGLLNYAVRAFSGFGLQRQRLGSSLLAGAVPLVFLWRLIWRFQFAPASLCRMPCTLRVLSAAAALLLAGVSSTITSGIAGASIFAGFYGEAYNHKDLHSKLGVILSFVPALLIIFLIGDPFKGLILSQMLLSVQLPITVFTQVYLTSSKKVMGQYVNSRSTTILLVLLGTMVTVLNIALLISLF